MIDKNFISVSVICMDPMSLGEDVKTCVDAGVDYMHIDVMDGHYVPRYGIYPEIAARIADTTDIPMDVHLMVDEPTLAIDAFTKISNVEYINFHFDGNEENTYRLCDRIRSGGKKPGIAMNLTSNYHHLDYVIGSNEISMLVMMGIHPGVLLQTSREFHAISIGKEMNVRFGKELDMMQLDGGVKPTTVVDITTGAFNNVVCGTSTIFKNLPAGRDERRNTIRQNICNLRKLIGETL